MKQLEERHWLKSDFERNRSGKWNNWQLNYKFIVGLVEDLEKKIECNFSEWRRNLSKNNVPGSTKSEIEARQTVTISRLQQKEL